MRKRNLKLATPSTWASMPLQIWTRCDTQPGAIRSVKPLTPASSPICCINHPNAVSATTYGCMMLDYSSSPANGSHMPRPKTSPFLRSVNHIDVVISDFGREVTRKLRTGHGSQEDHLRGPFERMLRDVARSLGLAITPIGETRLPDLSIRPDYAIDVANARVGYVELKRPGYGIPGLWKRPTPRDKKQWEQLQSLPNLGVSCGVM
jgi:hypothetical protein